MRFLLAIFFLNLFALYASAQSSSWEKQFHFDKWTGGGAAIETQDGGFIVCCGAGDDSTGNLWLLKLSKYGNIEWRKIIDPDGGGLEIKLVQKVSGVYLMYDEGNKYDSSIKKTIEVSNIIEFGENGDILWKKDFDLTNGQYSPFLLLPLNGGNYLQQSAWFEGKIGNNTHTKMLIQKFDRNHTVMWSDTFSFGAQTGASSMIKTRDNKLLIGGGAGFGIYEKFSFLLTLDTNGKKINYNAFPFIADSSEQIENIKQLKNGDNLVQTTKSFGRPMFFTLTDSIGNLKKRWEIDGYPHYPIGFEQNGDSILLLTDLSFITGPLVLAQYDTDFKLIWLKKFNLTSYYYNSPDYFMKTSDKGFLLVGTRSTSTYSDMVVIKLDSNCNLAKEDLSCVDDFDEAMIQNDCGLVYPNPATTTIYINPKNINTGGQPLNLDIFDSRGQLVSISTGIGTRITQKDIGFLNKGLYFYRLYAGGQVFCDGKFVKE